MSPILSDEVSDSLSPAVGLRALVLLLVGCSVFFDACAGRFCCLASPV